MEEHILNANQTEEVVQPQDVEQMDQESFEAYIESVKNADGEVQTVQSGTTEPAEDKPYMSFATREELQAFQNQTIGNRLREIREAEEERKREFDSLLQFAKNRYQTTEDGDAIARMMQELTQNEQEVKMQQQQISQKAEAIQADWLRQAEAIRERIPEFDLERAFLNPAFYKKVVEERASIAEAYLFTKEKTPPERSIREVGNSPGGIGGRVNTDVGTMSDDEFDAYIRKIKNE